MPSNQSHTSVPKRRKAVFQFVLLFFLFSLALSGFPLIALFVGFLSISTFFLFSFFSLRSLTPELTRKQVTSLISDPSYWRNPVNKSILNVLNGDVSGESPLPTQQKSSWILHVDPSSAAVIYRPSIGCELLCSGIHAIKKDTTLCAAFPLFPQKVVFGPESETSLAPKKGGEGLADYHARISKAGKTVKTTIDGITIISKLEVFYRIDIEKHRQELLQLVTKHVNQISASGSIMTKKFLEDQLLKTILEEWENIAITKTFSNINSSVPFKLFQEERSKYGLVYQAFVREVYKE